ncbi:MAG: hypothetical protein EOO51_12560 [Flavobacterium sp.]|nr:MAG: hypothetical protein EOO51_12560 [Flavobacterium sp.]
MSKKLSELDEFVGSLPDGALFYVVSGGLPYKLTKAQLMTAQGFLKLTGTETDGPITGPVQFSNEDPDQSVRHEYSVLSGYQITHRINADGKSVYILFTDYNIGFAGVDSDGYNFNLVIEPEGVIYNSENPSSKGFSASSDFTDNISDLDYIQKKGVVDLIAGASMGAGSDRVANISARNAYDVPNLLFQILVDNDGDGNWALYMATSTGVGATFIKISDPDLLNAVMSNAAIKTAYELNANTNAFTDAEKSKLSGIASGATANDTDANLKNRANHTGTQTADTITDGVTNKVYTSTEQTKLAGIATGATANDTDANLKNRSNHTGTQSADTITDGTTNKAYTATERTKLAGITSGATANDTDANLKNRANHTGTQLASTISDFASAVTAQVSGVYQTIANFASDVRATVLTGFSAAAGTVSASDSILSAINKIVGNIAVNTSAIAGKQDAAAWVDYSGTSTIVGFSSFLTKIVEVITVNKKVTVLVNITGTSNSTSFTFTLPTAMKSGTTSLMVCYVTNAGTTAVGTVYMTAGSNIATVSTNIATTGTFTASGTKAVIAQFTYEIP